MIKRKMAYRLNLELLLFFNGFVQGLIPAFPHGILSHRQISGPVIYIRYGTYD
jgi:hypothetical protein